MKIVLNTHRDDAGARICIHDLGERLREHGSEAVVGDWDNYDRYDVAVFMGYDDDAARARAQNPSIRVVLADPKQSRAEWIEAARRADGLLVSSVEQRDVFLRLNRNAHVFFMFPALPATPRVHTDGDRLVVGYHGNRVHLEAAFHTVLPALENLAARRSVELVALYNLEAHGRARLDGLRHLKVEHVQWTPDYAPLSRTDLGIVPSELPVRDRQAVLAASAFPDGELMYEPFDHLVRFKASTNPGRLFPFAQLGVPVIADFVPSAGQFVVDGQSGLLASSLHGWLDAFEKLAESPELRMRLATSLRERLTRAYDAQVPELLSFLREPAKKAPRDIAGAVDVADELARLSAYGRPRGPARPRFGLKALRARMGR